MRYAAIAIVLALLSQTAAAQTELFSKTEVISKDPAKVRQFIASQPIGQKLNVFQNTGPNSALVHIGVLSKVEADTFEITDDKRARTFAYAAVTGVSKVGGPVEKKGFWKRVGNKVQTSLAVAAIFTLLAVTYPVDLAVGQSTNAKARALEREIAKSLPQGSASSQVVAFLDARKIEHSGVYRNQLGKLTLGGTIRRGWGYYISLVFLFDEADRLTDCDIAVFQDTL